MSVQLTSFMVWGANIIGHRWITLMSRVIEKSGRYVVAMIWEVLGKLNLDGVTQINFWSDCGPQFKNVEVLGTAGILVPQKYHVDAGVFFGPDEHLKHRVDGFFRKLKFLMKQEALRRWLSNIDDVEEIFTADFKERRKLDADIVSEEYFNFMPGNKKDIPLVALKKTRCRSRLLHAGLGVSCKWNGSAKATLVVSQGMTRRLL